MNTAVAQLDRFLRESDPATAHTVEQIVLNLISLRPANGKNLSAPTRYSLPSRSLGALAGLDLTKLAHVDDD